MFLFMFHNQIITCYYYRTNCYVEVSIRFIYATISSTNTPNAKNPSLLWRNINCQKSIPCDNSNDQNLFAVKGFLCDILILQVLLYVLHATVDFNIII